MKKFILLLVLLSAIISLKAQDYQISFAGTGASTTVDTVTVENQTQGKSISLLGSETLHLLAIVTGNALELDNLDFPLHIYPNPSSDYFTLEFGAKKSGTTTIRLFDLIGREMANLKQTLPSGINSFRVSGLNDGIYTIKVDIDNQSYSGKLISQSSSNSEVTIKYIGNKGAVQETITLKNATTEHFWQYNTGDILRFTGTSGSLNAVITDIPTKSKILTFNFTASLPTVTTTAATNIISTEATLGGNLISDGGVILTERGICFSQTQNPTTLDTKVINGTDIGTFSSTISGLTPNTIYYVRAYATNSQGTAYGAEINFKTLVTNPPYRASMCVAPTEYDKSNEVNIPYTENEPIYLDTPAIEGFNLLFLSIPADKTISVKDGAGLDMSDFIRFVGIDNREGYRNNLIYMNLGKFASINPIGFTIFISDAHILFSPTVTTSGASGITATSVVLEGIVTSDGNDPSTERGIIYSTTENATSSYTKINSGNGLGSFSSTVTELTSNTTYYARAFAANSQGTTFGPQINFKTIETNLLYHSHMSVGESEYDFKNEVSIPISFGVKQTIKTPLKATEEYGYLFISVPADKPFVVYNLFGEDVTFDFLNIPAISDNRIGYQNNLIHRDFNAYDISYSTTFSINISTAQILYPATIITVAASGITATSAVLGGSVMSDGNDPTTEKGIVLSTFENPTIIDRKVANGTGTGSFSSTISGLTGNTTYFVRAFATNSKGTVYGSQVSFKTLLQYRLAMCVAKTEYDKSSEVNIPYIVNKEIKLNSPLKDGYNYFFISIPANKKFVIKDEMRSDASSDFQKVGEDNREGYWNNNIYKFREIYSTGYSRNFYLTISDN